VEGEVAASNQYGGRGRRLVATADWGGRDVRCRCCGSRSRMQTGEGRVGQVQ
jgi:hypothetical protein